MNYKFLGVGLTALVSFILSAPSALHQAAGGALWFLIVDTFTGYLCARQNGSHTSSAFRKKLNSKLGCYAGIIGLTAGISVIAGSCSWIVAGFWAIMAAEGLSIKENVTGMIATGGPEMAPIVALLDKIGAVLSSSISLSGIGKSGSSDNGSTP